MNEQAPEDAKVERGGMDEESGVPVTETEIEIEIETSKKPEDRDSDV